MHFRQLSKFALLCVCTATLCRGMMALSSGSGPIESSVLSDAESTPRLLSNAEIAHPIAGQQDATTLHGYFDPHVRPAMATSDATLVAAAVVGQSGFSIKEVLNGVYRFEIGTLTSPLRLVTNTATVTLKGTGAKSTQRVAVTIEGVPDVASKFTPSSSVDDLWSVEVTLPKAGVHTLQIILQEETEGANGTKVFKDVFLAPSLKISLPVTANPAVPALDKVSNTAFVPLQDMATATTGVKIYGRFLELAGQQASQRNRLKFLVFDNNKTTKDFIGEAQSGIRYSNTDSWRATLELPPLPRDFNGKVVVIAEQPGHGPHSLATKSVDFVMFSTANTLVRPSKPGILKLVDPTPVAAGKDANGVALLKSSTFQASVTTGDMEEGWIVFFLNGNSQPFVAVKADSGSGKTWTAAITAPSEGRHDVVAAAVVGNLTNVRSVAAPVLIRSTGPRVLSVEPTNLTFSADHKTITVRFSPDNKLDVTTDAAAPNTNHEKRSLQKANFVLKPSESTALTPETVKYNPADNSITLLYQNAIPPELYKFTVENANILDVFGNTMVAPYETELIMPVGGDTATVAPGISGPTGPYVPFGEYTKPRPFIDGFNPSDHVETRVSRLYYFRDAHRVAQIVNRDAKSYNRAAVDMQQQLADKSRQLADQATDDRRAKERKAVEAAKKTREAEQELQRAEQSAQLAAQQAANAAQDRRGAEAAARNEPDAGRREAAQATAENLSDVVRKLEDVAESARRHAQTANDKVQHLRDEEAKLSEEWQSSIAVEDRAREEQFRREVAAAQADPDTYAPGQPDSIDPVRQVSVSVIGEGLIQLRGPIKGINIIRTTINQIDAPVGQVRVGVHTVQINGEKGDRMEVVAGKIQRYIDHSRFLTLQSAEMLRKAIVQVAAQKAIEQGSIPGLTQEQRDRSYLHAFFGTDFIHELEAMDSEFLATGNKLLSIHSMDSTSLASAMFIMALAKNTTRMQILQTFEVMMQSELPMAEQNYFEAGLTCDGKEKLFGKYCSHDEFCMMSQNARFQSIRGMFNVEISSDDTMTPIQREFVRLAQIFKSRLIVEMELKQRIMERSVIEERLGDREKELKDAKRMEQQAKDKLHDAQEALKNARKTVLVAAVPIQAKIQAIRSRSDEAEEMAKQTTEFLQALFDAAMVQSLIDSVFGGVKNVRTVDEYLEDLGTDRRNEPTVKQLAQDFAPLRRSARKPLGKDESVGNRIAGNLKSVIQSLKNVGEVGPGFTLPPTFSFELLENKQPIKITVTRASGDVKIDEGVGFLKNALTELISDAEEVSKTLALFRYNDDHQKQFDDANAILQKFKDAGTGEAELLDSLHRGGTVFEIYHELADHVIEQASAIGRDMDYVIAELSADRGDTNSAYRSWIGIQERITRYIGAELRREAGPLLTSATSAFETLIEANLEREFALSDAEGARRPLDHKKFLDMLVDEMEDKYIELLEGTRAHTANIDAYIKRLITSLDDDFNTQFYYPTFRKVRDASQMWDVQMGQVETTTVLANNRAFAKVSPEATMEFDLPKRDILIAEAMDGAKAMIDDFGALAQDPTFLAMSKLGSGAPTSTQAGGASGGQSTVRNVLPGLSTDTAESVMSQQGPGGSQFGAAMEALIPDPAIYKFETGTGWEIRPVIQPDGQALVFHFNYMYTTNVREPVRADEKHLGRVKRHFVDTDVQLSNFELREISRYTVALKASRTSRGVPLFEDIPLVGVLFRPQPSDESSLQQNIIMGQATIFPTVFDLMGLRWAPVVADLDPLRLSNDEFIVRNRRRTLMNRVFDQSSSEVDKFLRIPDGERRMDLYRSQETIPSMHPNGYDGPGANLRDSQLQEGYDPTRRPESQFIPGESIEGSPYLRSRRGGSAPYIQSIPLLPAQGSETPDHSSRRPIPGPRPVVSQQNAPASRSARLPTMRATIESQALIPSNSRPISTARRLPPVDNLPGRTIQRYR